MAAAALAPAIIYFDNDHSMIHRVSSVCPTIRAIRVDETSPFNPALPWNSPVLDTFYAKVSAENPYLKFMKAVTDTERYDPVSGMTDAHIATVNAWLAETEGNPRRYALFDWDRTLSKIEGIIVPSAPYSLSQLIDWAKPQLSGKRLAAISDLPEITADHVLEYLCEGMDRVIKLKTMMANLVAAGVEIVILTNNGACQFPAFLDLVRALLPAGYDRDPRICSKAYGGDKGAALAADERFAGVCGIHSNNLYSGGRRHRKANTRRDQRTRRAKRKANTRRRR